MIDKPRMKQLYYVCLKLYSRGIPMNKFENAPPQAILYIRILAGGYLMYLSKNLYNDMPEGPFYWIPVVAFAVIGLVLLVISIRQLIRVNKQEAEEAARAAAEAEAAELAAAAEEEYEDEEDFGEEDPSDL